MHVRLKLGRAWSGRNNRARARRESAFAIDPPQDAPRRHHEAASRSLTEPERRGPRCRCHAKMQRGDGADGAGVLGRLVRTTVALVDHLRRLRVKHHTRRTRSTHEVYGHKTRARCDVRHQMLATEAVQAARASRASGGACHPCGEPACPGPQRKRVAVCGRTAPMLGALSEPPRANGRSPRKSEHGIRRGIARRVCQCRRGRTNAASDTRKVFLNVCVRRTVFGGLRPETYAYYLNSSYTR